MDDGTVRFKPLKQPDWSRIQVQEETTQPTVPQPQDLTSSGYTVEDLTKDEYYKPILNYMVDRFGTHLENKDRDEVVDKYINNMRGFSGGNSVRALNEIAYLSSKEEGENGAAGEAYAIFENLPGIFSDESSWSNTLDGVVDYTRGAILDPVNVLGGMIGKSVGAAGFKTSSLVAKQAAQKSYQRATTRSIAKGLGAAKVKDNAEKAAFRSFNYHTRLLSKKATERAARKKELVFETKNKLLKQIATKGNLAETGTIALIDAVAAGATDWAYQSGLYMTEVQEERSVIQTIGTSIATLLGSGALVSLGGLAQRKGANIGPDIDHLNTSRRGVNLSGVVTQINNNGDKVTDLGGLYKGNWKADVAKGKELSDLDTEFWITFAYGNEEMGVKGLIDSLVDQNYAWVRKSPDERISDYLGEHIKNADPEGFQSFIKEFGEFSGKSMDELKKYTQEEVGDIFKRKLSDSGKILRLSAEASKKLNISENNLTAGDLAYFMNEGRSPGLLGKAFDKFEAKMEKLTGRAIPRGQNRLIRMLVANLSTTQLNLLGWATATTMNSATDLVTAAIQMPVALATGNKVGIKNSMLLARNSFTKLQNTLDASTTYEQFMKYARARPKTTAELTNILAGGVENVRKGLDDLDLEDSIHSIKFDRVVDFIQDLSLVRMQDGITKSIEFMTALDSGIRKEYGMSYADFMGQSDYWKRMNTKEFHAIEQRAVTTTLDNTFSRSFSGAGGAVGDIAKIVEEARNIPVVGMLVPFGRFFNNTVAFMSDYGGLSLAARTVGLHSRKNSTETTANLMARTAVGWGTILALAPRESEFIDMGLTWDEQTNLGDATGAITTEEYNFPYVFFKGIARVLAHKQKGDELPENLLTEIAATIGPESLTRNLVDTFGVSGEAFLEAIADENATDVLLSLLAKSGAQVGSSATRFLEPINSAIGIVKGEDRVVQDRRQGAANYNNTVRYIDNIIGLVGGEFNEQREIASRGALRPQDSRFVSPVKEVKVTNTSRLAAMAGIKEWDSKITWVGKDVAASSNRYAQLYNRVNEKTAGFLLNSEKFQRLPREFKRVEVDKLFRKNKKLILQMMQADIESGDHLLWMMGQIHSNYSSKDISRAKEDLGFEGPLSEMEEDQLSLLETNLEFRKKIGTAK